jgi:hypothetical protein
VRDAAYLASGDTEEEWVGEAMFYIMSMSTRPDGGLDLVAKITGLMQRVQDYFEANGLHFDVEYISNKVIETDDLTNDLETWFARAKAAIMEDTML